MTPEIAKRLDAERSTLVDKMRAEMRRPPHLRDTSVAAVFRARIREITKLLREGDEKAIVPPLPARGVRKTP